MVHSPSKVIAPPPPPPLPPPPPPVLPPPALPLAFLKRKQVMQVHDYNSGAVKLWWPTINCRLKPLACEYSRFSYCSLSLRMFHLEERLQLSSD